MRTSLAVLVALALPRLAAADNHCELTATGDATATISVDAATTQQGKLTAATDYWMSEAQLRGALAQLAGLGGKLSKPEQARKVDDAMKRDPRFMLLSITCLADGGGVILSAARGSKYADLPFAPQTYAIAPSLEAKPGELTAMVHLVVDGKRESFAVKRPGKLVLTQFDGTGIAGSFTLEADARGAAPRHVSLTGQFHYACSGEACK